MTPFVTTGHIVSGVLKVRNLKALKAHVHGWRNGEVIIRISRAMATRSLDQNAWYWSQIVGLIAEHTGYTPDETHEVLKQMFLPKTLAIQDGNGEVINELVIGGTTTSLNRLEFGDYCERIRLWAWESLGVDIPNPASREVA